MSGPNFSPDGNWMWNGTEWIPAPPKEQVLPQSSIDEAEVTNIANESGVDPEHLTQVAPYFDENQDRILQQTELQQAAMSIAHEPNVPSPQPVMPQQQFTPTAPMAAAPMPAAPMGGIMPTSTGNLAFALNWVALGLTAAAITLIFIAMFSNSWMVYEDDVDEIGKGIYFGLTEYDNDWKGNGNEYDDDNECGGDECSDMGSAGTAGLIFLWIAVAVAIGSLVLIGLNSFGVYQSKFGMISAFVSGGLAIIGIIIWLIMFPEIEGLGEISNGPGFSFYLAIIGGLLCISAGIISLVAGRGGGQSFNAPMQGIPQQQYNQQ